MSEQYEKKGYLLEDFRVFHLKDAQGAMMDYHYHEFCKIMFLISGAGAYSIMGKRYALNSGDIVLIGNKCVHRPEFESGIPYERVILYISPDFLEKNSTLDGDLKECFNEEHGHVFRPDEETREELFGQLRLLEEVFANEQYGRTILINSILLRILVEIVRGFRYGNGKMTEPLLPTSKRMREIVEYLEQHLTEEIHINDLAERFYLSRFHLMRCFKEEMGTTIHAYVSDRRLLLAREYILQGKSTTEACFASGYQSYASFARAYGKFFGETPTGRKNTIAVKEETFE